jgi:hypothetical protein
MAPKAAQDGMRIDPADEIAGVQLVEVRRLFRKAGISGEFSSKFVQQTLGISERQARDLCAGLLRGGFLTRQSREQRNEWNLTDEGVRLRCATAAKAFIARPPIGYWPNSLNESGN